MNEISPILEKDMPLTELKTEPMADSSVTKESPTEEWASAEEEYTDESAIMNHAQPPQVLQSEPTELESTVGKSSFNFKPSSEYRKSFKRQGHFGQKSATAHAKKSSMSVSKTKRKQNYTLLGTHVERNSKSFQGKVDNNQFIHGNDKLPDTSELTTINNLQIVAYTNTTNEYETTEDSSVPLDQQRIPSHFSADSESDICEIDDQLNTTDQEAEPTAEDLLLELRKIYRKYPKFFHC